MLYNFFPGSVVQLVINYVSICSSTKEVCKNNDRIQALDSEEINFNKIWEAFKPRKQLVTISKQHSFPNILMRFAMKNTRTS